MADFLTLYSELILRFPALDPFLAKRFINRALGDIYGHRRWSFLIAEDVLAVPAAITAGAVSVTRHSDVVTPNATALAALDAAGAAPLVTKRQFSLGAGSPIYNIPAYDGATLTLDRPYREATNAAASYQVFRCFFEPPSADFVAFVTVKDIENNYNLRLHYQAKELNRLDPQRSTTGEPLYLASYKSSSSAQPLFEMWPHPTSEKYYSCLYQRRGADLVADSDTAPAVISDQMIIGRALRNVYQWAIETAYMPNGKAVDWRFLMAEADKSFVAELRESAREDNEAFNEMIVEFDERRQAHPYLLDANWIQSHAV
jgi:hypothetical protein